MLSALQSRLELSLPWGNTSAVLALPWHGTGGGPGEVDQLAAAHAAACHRIADLEAAVTDLEVSTSVQGRLPQAHPHCSMCLRRQTGQGFSKQHSHLGSHV